MKLLSQHLPGGTNENLSPDSNQAPTKYESTALPLCQMSLKPITVAAQSKAWTVFARWNAGIVGSNPTRGMDVCVR
jgi:hypothetical protein